MRLEHVDLDPDDVRLSQVLCCTTSRYVPSHPQLDRHPHCKQMRHRRDCAEGKEGVASCIRESWTMIRLVLHIVSFHYMQLPRTRSSTMILVPICFPRVHCRTATYVSFAHIDDDRTTFVASGARRTRPRVLRPQTLGVIWCVLCRTHIRA